MDLARVLQSQFEAALDMLRQAVVNCPDDLWDDPAYHNRCWHIAYHALFCAHLYLQESEQDFRPWAKHRPQHGSLGPPETAPGETPALRQPYTREEILEYLAVCLGQVEEKVASLDPAGMSGFHWLPFDKLELQFYNIRHIQQHVGELAERLGQVAAAGVEWVAMRRPDSG